MKNISNCVKEISTYGGSEVKMTYYIDNQKYMVKFPDPIREKNKNVSYINNQFSEHVGCQIFKLFCIDTQDTELVKCNINGKEKIAVACLDFLKPKEELVEFKNLSYSINPEKKYTSSIEDIFEMLDLIPNLENRDFVKSEFWHRFIVDTLIGNADRHLGNWALIKNENKYRLAPVYDCGSSLNPLLSEAEMKRLLENEKELKNVAYNVKTAYKLNGKSITYIDMYLHMPKLLESQLTLVVPIIDMNVIKKLIYDMEGLSEVQKEFYYKTILIRKELILDKAYNKYFNDLEKLLFDKSETSL